jgi:uncharacterized protein (DUF1697 family)
MSNVVFIRAANVGGKNVFKPAQIAAALPHLQVINVGAAGTFLVRERASAARIRAELLVHIPFVPELAVIPAADILALVRSAPFRGTKFSKDVRGWTAVLCGKSRARPTLPISVPDGKAWSVRFDRLEGAFALGLWRRRPKGFVFPNQVVEKVLGVRATMRWWETIERIARLIEDEE